MEYKKIIFIKNCPNCKKELYYSCQQSLDTSIRKQCLCRTCSRIGNKNPSFGSIGYWNGKVGPNKGKIVSNEFRKLISNIVKGRKHSQESIQKMVGRKLSDYTKYKMRLNRLKDLRKKGIFPGCKISKNYNPNACEFIKKFGYENGYSFQHAMNGGEYEIGGYFLDGYDKEKNIIFEYDEKHHWIGNKLRKKDIDRQNIIIKKLNPTKFLRYDERNNKLYDVLNKEGICLLQ